MLDANDVLQGLSDWPAAKLDRARVLGQHLLADLDAFGNAGHFYAEVEPHGDQLGADVVMRVREHPPLVEYSLRLGEIVHNIRGALDSALWEIAGLGGASVSKRGMVTYPANVHENEWLAARQHDADNDSGLLVTLDPRVLDRVKATQPFVENPDDPKLDGLAAIARFSNYDKHRGMVATLAVPDGAQIRLPTRRVPDPRYDNVDGDLQMTPLADWAFVDGLHTMRFRWSIPMTVEAGAQVNVPWYWAVADPQLEGTFRLTTILAMAEHAEAVIHHVRTGSWP